MKITKKSTLEDLWGDEALGVNWTSIPNSLIFLQSELGISSQEFVVLLNLCMHRFSSSPSRMPHPSVASIASRTGQTPRNVRRHLSSLEEKGLLRRIATSSSGSLKGKNQYDITPLIEQLTIKTPELQLNLQSRKLASR
ncbi:MULTISPECIES: helix-turn-helix domain-containing protein [Vibrio harveyi group]|uniref:helix-turn-helix domain-containing protein n=1 Tax=Vibrio harveyi group TaxID=717610 RepID=UPI000CE50A1B|nr:MULTISPECIES: helix-turn-helix domain-containing protein [Vibrio harveyi group]MBS9903171.1 helix-turn-helix domain-containing protein [Vibrio alginolyticus]